PLLIVTDLDGYGPALFGQHIQEHWLRQVVREQVHVGRQRERGGVVPEELLDLHRVPASAEQDRCASHGTIIHCDHGTQGGFKWSSQRLVVGVDGDGCSGASAGGSCFAWSDVVAGSAFGGAAGGSAAVLAGDRGGLVERGCGRGGGGVRAS